MLTYLIGNHLEYVENNPKNLRSEHTDLYDLVRDVVYFDKDQNCPGILPPLFSAAHTGPYDESLFDSAYTYFGTWKLMSELTLEVHRQRDFLRQKPTPSSQDLKRIEDLTAMLLILEYQFVPITTPESSFAKQVVLRASGQVDLEQTLATARKLGWVEHSHQLVSPTPKKMLQKHISQANIKLIDYLASGVHFYATGRIQKNKQKDDPIFACFVALCKTWADARQDIRRFDNIFKQPDVPRAPGEVFRGIGNFPKDSLEKWLTLSLKNEPLYLGIDNQPEVMFASRRFEVARSYRDVEVHDPEKYHVVLAISQKNGVSIETIIQNKKAKAVMINSTQKFKVIEVFQDANTLNGVVIKLEEI
jgi:hypothetical protein